MLQGAEGTDDALGELSRITAVSSRNSWPLTRVRVFSRSVICCFSPARGVCRRCLGVYIERGPNGGRPNNRLGIPWLTMTEHAAEGFVRGLTGLDKAGRWCLGRDIGSRGLKAAALRIPSERISAGAATSGMKRYGALPMTGAVAEINAAAGAPTRRLSAEPLPLFGLIGGRATRG